MNKVKIILPTLFVIVLSCSKSSIYQVSENPDPEPEPEEIPSITDEALLDLTQRETFRYFWDFAEETSAAARERYHPENASLDAHVVTSGGTGFGLMAIIIGMERGYITRDEGLQRIGLIITFLETADRYHGAWPHWMDGRNGRVIPFSELDNGGDLVETAFLVQGLICLKEYLSEGEEIEQMLASRADALWKGVEWNWYTQNQQSLYWHWSPTYGFDINLQLKGYNEVLIAYVLAASSPDFSIEREVYDQGWASDGTIASTNTKYSIPLLVNHSGANEYGGPLFWAHYSYLGLDPRSLADSYVNYWEVNVNHTMINNQYCIENPKGYTDYGENCWGLTASYTRNNDGSLGYAAHRPGDDRGVISPTAAISSIPYTPEASLKALHYFYNHKEDLLGPAGFYDAFSPDQDFWVAEAYLAIDQGPSLVMIENYRSGLLWDLFMGNEEVRNGLDKLGFTY